VRLIALLFFASALFCDAADTATASLASAQSSPLVANGAVYFGSTYGNLYAIESPARRLKQKLPPVASF
jgi:hypothetical protein